MTILLGCQVVSSAKISPPRTRYFPPYSSMILETFSYIPVDYPVFNINAAY